MYSLKLDDKIKAVIKSFEEKDEMKDEATYFDIYDENKFRVKLVLDVEVLSPIAVSEYGQSLFGRLVNSEQGSRIEQIEDLINEISCQLDNKPVLNEDRIFFKLPVKDGKYKAEFDVPMDPATPEKSAIKPGSAIVIFCKPGLWANFGTGKAGVYFQIEKITTDQPKKKIRSKK